MKLNPTSRLAQFSDRFGENAYLEPENEERLLEGLVAMRDVQEIALILEQFPQISLKTLGRLIEDHPIPRLDSSTPGRDRQLELVCGAICRRGGMEVKLGCEPDLWCQVRGVWLGLAVKRVRSAKRFIDRLEEAAKQVERYAPYYGFAVMDCSLAWNPEMAVVLTSRPPEELAHEFRERLDRLLCAHTAAIDNAFARSPKALGLVCIDSTPVNRDGWERNQLSIFYMSKFKMDRHRSRIATQFFDAWVAGLPNCTSLDNLPRSAAFAVPPPDLVMPLRPHA